MEHRQKKIDSKKTALITGADQGLGFENSQTISKAWLLRLHW